MNCKNVELCKKKHERWKKHQVKHIPLGEMEHEEFLRYVHEGREYYLDLADHSTLRQFERMISNRDIKDIILNGWVIERSFYNDVQAVRLTILGYTRSYRPIHVVVQIENPNEWIIVTVYDPKSKSFKWENNYQERVCFCKEDDINMV